MDIFGIMEPCLKHGKTRIMWMNILGLKVIMTRLILLKLVQKFKKEGLLFRFFNFIFENILVFNLKVKVLGTLALLDEGETDWKVFWGSFELCCPILILFYFPLFYLPGN